MHACMHHVRRACRVAVVWVKPGNIQICRWDCGRPGVRADSRLFCGCRVGLAARRAAACCASSCDIVTLCGGRERVTRVYTRSRFDGIDVNMGCPEKSVTGKQGAGAALIRTPDVAVVRAGWSSRVPPASVRVCCVHRSRCAHHTWEFPQQEIVRACKDGGRGLPVWYAAAGVIGVVTRPPPPPLDRGACMRVIVRAQCEDEDRLRRCERARVDPAPTRE